MKKVNGVLASVVALVVGVMGVAGSAMAAEDDYRRYYDEALVSLEGVDVEKAAYLAEQAVKNQISGFADYIDVPFGIEEIEEIEEIEDLYLNVQSDHDDFGSYGGTFVGKIGLIAAIAGYFDPATGEPAGDWDTDTNIQELLTKNSTELLQIAKADPKYASDAVYKATVDQYQESYDRGVRILRRDLPKLGVTVSDETTAEQLVELAKALPEYTKFGNKENMNTVKSLYAAYADLQGEIACYESEFCRDNAVNNPDTTKRLYAELVAQAKLIDPNFTVDLARAKVESNAMPGVPDTGDEEQEDLSANMVTVALMGVSVVAVVLGVSVVAKRYVFSPLK